MIAEDNFDMQIKIIKAIKKPKLALKLIKRFDLDIAIPELHEVRLMFKENSFNYFANRHFNSD